jgi:hypothetical protein
VTTDGIQLAFRVAIPTHATITPDLRLRVWLDADDDRGTGLAVEGLDGADHFLLVDPTRFRPGEAVLYRCGGSTCTPVSSKPPELRYASGAAFLVEAFALGLERIERFTFHAVVTSGIRYDPVARRYDLANAHTDRAPDAGSWTYDARTVRYASFAAVPTAPRAGKRFTISMRADSARTPPTTNARVGCTLVIAPRRNVSTRSTRLTRNAAACAFAVPPETHGRAFQAMIRVTAGASFAESRLSGRIR